jgi:predicted PurR-regulated permease PerM
MHSDESTSHDRGARFFVLAASIVIVVAGLKAAAPLILPFLVSVLLAIISTPFVTWLGSRKVPTWLAVALTMIGNLAVIVVLGVIVGQSVNEFTVKAPQYQERIQELAASALAALGAHGIETSQWRPLQAVNPGALFDMVGSTLSAVAAVLSNMFVVLMLLFFILLEVAAFPAKLTAAFGERPDNRERFRVVTRQIQRYLGIKTFVSLATGVAAGLWVGLLGLGVPVLWGLLAFMFNFVPNIGSFVAAVPPVLLALMQFGPWRAVAVAAGYAVINLVLANFVEPRLMGRRLGLSTLVVVLSLVFWGWVWGPVGMILSVPLTVVVKIALENTPDLRWIAIMLDASPGAERGATSRR